MSIASMNTPQTPLNVQQPSVAPIPPVTPISSTTTTTPAPANNFTTTLEGLQASLAGKTLDTAAMKSNATAPYEQTLGHIDEQIAAYQIQAQAHQEAALKSGETTGYASREAQNVQRSDAIQLMLLQAQRAAAQGNIAFAEKHAQAAIDTKYGQMEIDLNTARNNIYNNYDSFTPAEKKKADATLLRLDSQDAFVASAKQQELAAQTEALKYAGVADAQTLQKMQGAANPTQVVLIAAQAGIQQPQAGRYKDTITTTTDAYGNQQQTVRVFDTLTGKFVGAQGQTASTFNSPPPPSNGSTQPSSGSSPSGTSPTSPSQPRTATPDKLSFDQYGLLANTTFNPNNALDQLSQRYLDQYIKNGSVPTASSLGRSMKPAALAQLDSRARELYFQATGTPLPDPKEIAGYKTQLIGNNKLINNLNVQEGTIGKNAELLLKNLNENNLNQNSQPINAFIDSFRNMLGDPDVAQFLAQNVTVGNELGSLLSLKNAQGTTVHDKLEAAGLINKNDSSRQVAAKVKILLQEAVNAHDAIKSANAELYKQTDPLLQNPNNPARSKATNVQPNQVVDPTGTVHTFQTKFQADNFRKAAGIK